MGSNLKPVVAEMKKFKDFIHGSEATCFQIFSKKNRLKRESENFFGYFSKKKKGTLIAANSAGMEIAMMINQSDGEGRTSANVTGVNALFADFDSGEMTLEGLLELPIPPHMIVETSPNKYHVYWLIKDCDVEQFKQVMKALAKKLGSDISVCDPARVMRIPGTINWKYDEPFLARIVHFEENAKPIALKRFIRKMKLKVVEPKQTVSSVADHQNSELTDDMAERIRLALEQLPSDDRAVWLTNGMAIHNVDQTERGYNLWTEWSRRSSKFDEAEQREYWSGFVAGKGVGINTLFWLANRAKSGQDMTFDEVSMVNYFADMCKEVLRYDRESRVWYHYVDGVWKIDSQAPVRLMREMILDLCQSKSASPMHDSIKRFCSASVFKSIVNHAELLEELKINVLDFDQNPDLLSVKNGVIDLRTGQFRSATAADLLRRQAAVEFDAQAKCPEWIEFMKSITRKDKDLYEYIRRALGYTLFGQADLQVYFLAVGPGGNGKGVLMHTLKSLLGDYAQSVAPNLLTSAFGGNANSPTPALAKLHGARLVICTELPTGRKFDDAFLKQYAGGDEITARHGYGNVFTFKPEGKLWLSTNEVPEISASDEAMWRRLRPIPFLAEFRGDAVDHKLEEKLAKEYPGILNWLLKGAQSYFENGLVSCPAVDKFKARLRKNADSLLAWMSECCVKSASASAQAGMAYDSYSSFMRSSGRKALSIQAFRAGLEKRGFPHKKRSSGNYYEGFRLR